jgi:hypothetical protein
MSGIFLVLAFGMLAGCPINLDTPRYPMNQPASADLVGIYVPTTETTVLISKGGYSGRSTSIELHADGTFRFVNVPDWWETKFGEPDGGFDNGNGMWNTAKQQEWWNLDLVFGDTRGFAHPLKGGIDTAANIIGQKPPYDLSLTIGDPDNGKEMRFHKVPTTTGP